MSNGSEDSTAADWNVELTAETADRAEALLRDFATDAELEMAVIVDRSGGMIAGVATRQNVDVSTVGALVAGAFGAMGALANELGEPKVAESLHHGSGDTIYLREIAERFVLLGVTSSELPSGLVREKGAQVADRLGAMLNGTEEEAVEDTEDSPPAEEQVAPQSQVSVEPQVFEEPEPIGVPVEVSVNSAAVPPVEGLTESSAPPVQTDVFVARPGSIEQGSAGESTGSIQTEIPVEDALSVSMASLNPTVRRPQEPEAAAPEPEPEPQKEETGENTSYVFEIG